MPNPALHQTPDRPAVLAGAGGDAGELIVDGQDGGAKPDSHGGWQ